MTIHIGTFGRAFETRKEANAYIKALKNEDRWYSKSVEIRRMSKKLFPRRKRLVHVGTYIEFINFA